MPNGIILSKIYGLENQGANFVEKWKTGFEIYGEQGRDSIHNDFNQLKITYCRIQKRPL